MYVGYVIFLYNIVIYMCNVCSLYCDICMRCTCVVYLVYMVCMCKVCGVHDVYCVCLWYLCICVCRCSPGGQRKMLMPCSIFSLSVNAEQAWWLASYRDPPISHTHCPGVTGLHTAHSVVYMAVGNWDSGPHACVPSVLTC